MKPRIALDARMAFHSGIGTYIRSLAGQLLKRDEFEWTLLGNTEQLTCFSESAKVVSVNSKIYSFNEQVELARKGKGYDLFHAPHYNASLLLETPLVVTVHDLIHFRFPEFFGRGPKVQLAKLLMSQILKKAKKIIAVSRATQKDLIEQFHVPLDKVRVIHEAPGDFLNQQVSETKIKEILQRLRISSPYLLYVGNLKPHKNVPRLIRAFQELKRDGLREVLVVVGKIDEKAVGADELHALLNAPHIISLGSLNSEDLSAIYKGARGFVSPSLWEGFGLPILEAFQIGLPVACSRIASHEEIAGEAGLYFNPESNSELKTALKQLLTDEPTRERLLQNGKQRLELFSWEKAAEETIEVYREVLGK